MDSKTVGIRKFVDPAYHLAVVGQKYDRKEIGKIKYFAGVAGASTELAIETLIIGMVAHSANLPAAGYIASTFAATNIARGIDMRADNLIYNQIKNSVSAVVNLLVSKLRKHKDAHNLTNLLYDVY